MTTVFFLSIGVLPLLVAVICLWTGPFSRHAPRNHYEP
jgi:hypothetical protein